MIHWNYDTLVSYYKKQWKLDISEILDKRAASGKRKGSNEERILVKKKKILVWEVPNCLPLLRKEKNNNMSIIKQLTNQSSLSEGKRNKDTIRILKENTFPDRHQMCFSKNKHIRKVLEKYPLFCSKHQVSIFSKYI